MYAHAVPEGPHTPTCNLVTRETASSRLWKPLRCAVVFSWPRYLLGFSAGAIMLSCSRKLGFPYPFLVKFWLSPIC